VLHDGFLKSDPIAVFVLPAESISNGTTFNPEGLLSARQINWATDRSWPARAGRRRELSSCNEIPDLDGSSDEHSCAFIIAGDLEEFAAEESAGEFAGRPFTEAA
jgi:hypothetical protein